MKSAIITGLAGLIGNEAVYFMSNKFDLIIGIDNNMRFYFFSESVKWNGLNEDFYALMDK